MHHLLAVITALLLAPSLAAQDFVQNDPMKPGERYTIQAAQGLTVELGPDGTEIFRASNGLHVIGHANLAGLHTLEVVNPGRLRYTPRSIPAIYDAFWVPTKEVPRGLDLGDELDKIPSHHKPYTPGTGGSGRGYVSPASVALAAPLSEDNDSPWALRRKALDVLRAWCIEELESRPLSHVPFLHDGDRYSRKTLNAGTPLEWSHQKRNEWGWNAWDTAHVYLCHAYTLAAYGDPLGTLMVSLVHRWAVCSAYPGICTNWITQPRGQGWLFELAAWSHLLELWPDQAARDCFTCGFTTDRVAILWIRHSGLEHWQRAGLGDNHNSPMGAEQARAHLGFQRAIRLWGLARMIRSTLPRETRSEARWLYDEELHYLEARSVSGGLLSRVVGTYRFTDANEAAEWAQTITMSGKNTWEPFQAPDSPLAELPAGWYVREVARVSDSEMLVAAIVAISRDADAARKWASQREKARWTYDLVPASVEESGLTREGPR